MSKELRQIYQKLKNNNPNVSDNVIRQKAWTMHDRMLYEKLTPSSSSSAGGKRNKIEPFLTFDITANWSLTTPNVVDEISFRTFLESGSDGDGNGNSLTNVVITDFLLIDGRLTCNLNATGNQLFLTNIEVTNVYKFGNIVDLEHLYLDNNNIVIFDPIIISNSLISLNLGYNQIVEFVLTSPLPNTLQELYINNNQIITFNPSIALPATLIRIDLGYNQIVTFNPSIALPNSLLDIYLNNNQIVTFDTSLPNSLTILNLGYNQIVTFDTTLPLPNSLQELYINNNQIVTFDPSIALPDSLIHLFIYSNQIVTFDPILPLPSLIILEIYNNQIITFNPILLSTDSLNNLNLESNKMTTLGYIETEAWANSMSVIPNRGSIYFTNNINSIAGTNLETILISKGWTVLI